MRTWPSGQYVVRQALPDVLPQARRIDVPWRTDTLPAILIPGPDTPEPSGLVVVLTPGAEDTVSEPTAVPHFRTADIHDVGRHEADDHGNRGAPLDPKRHVMCGFDDLVINKDGASKEVLHVFEILEEHPVEQSTCEHCPRCQHK